MISDNVEEIDRVALFDIINVLRCMAVMDRRLENYGDDVNYDDAN